jgi:quercetin dioxygenase-like cupin family protein
MILLKKPDKQIVLAALHEATEIKFFPSNDSITFQIIEGKIKIQSREEYITLNRGQILTLHKNLTLILTTKEETVFLLTIANGALQKSVN